MVTNDKDYSIEQAKKRRYDLRFQAMKAVFENAGLYRESERNEDLFDFDEAESVSVEDEVDADSNE